MNKKLFRNAEDRDTFAKIGLIISWIDDLELNLDSILADFFANPVNGNLFTDMLLSKMRFYQKIELLKELIKFKSIIKDTVFKDYMILTASDFKVMLTLNSYRNKLAHSGYLSSEEFMTKSGKSVKILTDSELLKKRKQVDEIKHKICLFILRNCEKKYGSEYNEEIKKLRAKLNSKVIEKSKSTSSKALQSLHSGSLCPYLSSSCGLSLEVLYQLLYQS